jgi:micrococcal nuclease
MLISRIRRLLLVNFQDKGYPKKVFNLFSFPKRIIAIGVGCILVYGGYTVISNKGDKSVPQIKHPMKIELSQSSIIEKVTINRVVDGDTLEVTFENKTERLRLIGVDTPEVYNSKKMRSDAHRLGISEEDVQKKGMQASKFVAEFLKERYSNQKIRLEIGAEERDRYGRLLGYVWFIDGKMLNEEIIKAGYGTAMVIPPNSKYFTRFQKFEGQARKDKIGIWE